MKRYDPLMTMLFSSWIIYFLFLGPLLISESSDIAVLIGVAIPVVLGALTYHRLTRSVSTKEETTK